MYTRISEQVLTDGRLAYDVLVNCDDDEQFRIPAIDHAGALALQECLETVALDMYALAA